jgi:hypothetical protein
MHQCVVSLLVRESEVGDRTNYSLPSMLDRCRQIRCGSICAAIKLQRALSECSVTFWTPLLPTPYCVDRLDRQFPECWIFGQAVQGWD